MKHIALTKTASAIALGFLMISACSNANSSEGSCGKGIEFDIKAESKITAGGVMRHCKLNMTVKNKLGKDVEGLKFAYSTELPEDDIKAQLGYRTAVQKLGAQEGIIGSLSRGATDEITDTLIYADCETITAITIDKISCTISGDGSDCSDAVSIGGNTPFEIR